MYNISCVLNSLSFGFVSQNILRELWKRGRDINLFLLSEPAEISSYNIEPEFQKWLQESVLRARSTYNKNDPSFKIWHINGSEQKIGNEQNLLTFHECSGLTPLELNILKNQKNVLVSSQYSKKIFEAAGLTNVVYTPLGFDDKHFKVVPKQSSDTISFLLAGKWEKRKNTEKVIKAWVKRFGGRKEFILNTLVTNPFFKQDVNAQLIRKALNGESPAKCRVNPLPYFKGLNELNEVFNQTDIVINMSGGEAWSIPDFSCLCLGKYGVILNATAMSDWAPDAGAVMVEPSGKEEVYDEIFFRRGDVVNNGEIFTWEEDAFIAGCEEAVKRFREKPVNEKGLNLQSIYTWQKTADIIEGALES